MRDDPIIKYHNGKEDFSAYPDATFPARALAFFIDAVILGVGQTALSALFNYMVTLTAPPVEAYLFLNVLYLVLNGIILPSLYFIPQIKRDGQTIGKKVLRIKILTEENTELSSGARIFKREIFGKFVSALFFGAGYLVRLFGLDTFHDKIAKTKVVSIKNID